MASQKCASLFFFFFFFFTISLLCISSEAGDFLVGGKSNAWVVPPTTEDSLNEWATKNRFRVGDSLVWEYDASKDSVLQVTREGYLSCDRSSPIAEHKDGATVVKLERSGPYYFISGAAGACEEGERLIVVVLSKKHSLLGLAPAPSPASGEGPALAPASGGASQVEALNAAGLLAGALLVALGVLLH